MKTNTTVTNVWLKPIALARSCMLVAAVVFAFTGCQTNKQPAASAAAASARSNSNPATHAEAITLREGDVVNVLFPGSPSLDTTQPIRRDGKIVLPLVGEVEAAGQTPESLQKALIKLYAPQLATDQILVTVQSSFIVYVTGAVLRPGKVQSDRPISALDAIMEAGGFDYTRANLKAVEVIRQEDNHLRHYRVNLKSVMAGQSEQPFYLKPSDIVYVPEKFSWF